MAFGCPSVGHADIQCAGPPSGVADAALGTDLAPVDGHRASVDDHRGPVNATSTGAAGIDGADGTNAAASAVRGLERTLSSARGRTPGRSG